MAKVTKPTTFTDGQVPTAAQFNSNFDIIYNEFNGNIDNNNIKGTAAISGTKLADGSIGATKLGTGAIYLNHAEATTTQTGITNEVDLTGLSITVSVPSGGRKVKISASVPVLTTVADSEFILRIKEGTTTLQTLHDSPAIANYADTFGGFVVITPTAGSHTYRLTLQRANGTGTCRMDATTERRAFILAELI